ncbi:glycosyltransferase family 25 protein [Nitrosospira multiformis]|nr:glycosyltransferase family 25 protein [Nitrosospira multiformis]
MPCQLSAANRIANALSRAGIASRIVQGSSIERYDERTHFVINAPAFVHLPASYIAVQVEDSSKADMFTEAYLQILQNASAILDYSTANIAFVSRKGLDPRRIFYLPLDSYPDNTDYFFYRFLLATDNISFEEFWHLAGHKAELPSDTVCLSLPEYVERAAAFNEENRFGFSCFPGLRHTQSWIGCALSYKYLIMLAREQGLRQIMICEDDVEFPSDFEMRWRDIRECLNEADITWDIFAGLIADLDKDVDVLGLYKFRGQQLAVINKLMSMVFNVYSERVYDTIARWDQNNHDVTTNTIDRYLERQGTLNILTVDPFLVGHKESQQSTIWGVENTHYTDLIKASNQLLKEKILIHKKNASFPKFTLGCPDLPLRDVTHQHRDQEL